MAYDPIFGVCDKLRFKLACTATGTSLIVEILHVASVARIFFSEGEQQRF